MSQQLLGLFSMAPSGIGRMKVCLSECGHITKMVFMPL